MSVINQMLQDLESRRGALENEAVAATPIRPAGVIYERRRPKIAIIIAVATLLAAVLVWGILRPSSRAPQSAPMPITATPATPAPAPVAALPAAVTPPTKRVTVVAQAPRAVLPASPAKPVPENNDASLKAAKAEPEKPALAAPALNAAKNEVPPLPAPDDVVSRTVAANDGVIAPAAPSSKSSTRSRSKTIVPGMEAAPQNFKNRTPQQRTDERYREALRKLSDGQTAQARGDLAEVLQNQPKHSGARLALVGIELDEKHIPQAERLLRDGIQLQPQESTFNMALARLEVERGDVAAGLATLNRGMQNAGDDPEYHAFMAALLQRANRHAEAIEHYQIALRQREAANWLVGLGISLEGANRAREAEQIYRRAQQSNALPSDLQDFVSQRLQQLKS